MVEDVVYLSCPLNPETFQNYNASKTFIGAKVVGKYFAASGTCMKQRSSALQCKETRKKDSSALRRRRSSSRYSYHYTRIWSTSHISDEGFCSSSYCVSRRRQGCGASNNPSAADYPTVLGEKEVVHRGYAS
eukprot:Filipodium_phascolosomae@DN3658_c0_g1_i1.p1